MRCQALSSQTSENISVLASSNKILCKKCLVRR